MPPDLHPPDRHLAALIDGALDDGTVAVLRDHVRGCPRCQLRCGQAMPERILGRADSGLSVATIELDGTSASDPAPGQVWRLSWPPARGLGVVTKVDEPRATIVPLGTDLEVADDWTLIVDGDQTSFGIAIALHVPLETSVPWCVLDERVGLIEDLAGIEEIRARFQRGEGSAGGLRTGEPVLVAVDPRLEDIAELSDQFHYLSDVDWVRSGAPATTTLGFDQLQEAGIGTQRALELVRGAPLFPAEADLLEPSGGITRAPLEVPVGLRSALERPKRRSALRRAAREHGWDESFERSRIAAAVSDDLLAARRTSRSTEPDWESLVDRILNS